MPLSLSTEELELLLTLAAPIDHRNRDQFLREVAAELEAASAQTGVGPGPGLVHRVARTVQRRFFVPLARAVTPRRALGVRSVLLLGLRVSGVFEVCGAFSGRVWGEDFTAGVGDAFVTSRGGEERRGLPLALRNVVDEALSLRRPAREALSCWSSSRSHR